MTSVAPRQVQWRLAVPTEWERLPVDPVALRHAARAWMLRRLAHLPRDRTARQRRDVEQQLVELVSRPGSEYAVRLLALAVEAGPVPITATCVVSVLPADRSAPDVESLAEALGGEVRDLGAFAAAVVVRDEAVPDRPDPVDDEELADLASRWAGERLDPEQVGQQRAAHDRTRVVQVHVPVPDAPRTLALVFSTPLVPLFEPMTQMFLALASTLQLRDLDGTWR